MKRKYLLLILPFLSITLTDCQKPLPDNISERPNIIFLLTDDQRWDAMGAMGNPIIQTPNMDRLAQEGILFQNAYVTTSICAISRASIFSGQYARRHDIHDFGSFFQPETWANSYPMLLRNAGYHTGFVGKFGVGGMNTMPTHDFDFWKGIAGQPKYEHTDSAGNYKHLTQILGEQSLEFFQTAPDQKPFCLSVSFKAPHVQDTDPRQFLFDSAYIDLFTDVTIPPPVTGSPKYWQQFPDFFRTDSNESRRRWKMRFDTPDKYQASVKGYYRLIYGIDRVIGEMQQELDRLGLAENTVIILLGDNGFYLGEHGLAGKWYGHQESIRVPLLIYDPRRPTNKRGIKSEGIALNIDIAPTILGYAGIDMPAGMQGGDLRKLVDKNPAEWRTDFFYEHLFEYRGRIPRSEGMVTKDWKYMVYIDQQPPYEQLFDLSNDPYETNNLALDTAFSDQLNLMKNRYSELKKEVE